MASRRSCPLVGRESGLSVEGIRALASDGCLEERDWSGDDRDLIVMADELCTMGNPLDDAAPGWPTEAVSR